VRFGYTSSDPALPGTQSDRARRVVEREVKVPAGAPGRVVYGVDAGAVTTPRVRAAIEASMDRVRAAAHVSSVTSPFTPAGRQGLSAGGQDLVARVQASRSLCDLLSELRESDAGGAVVHGDLRWDNCLVIAPASSRRRTRVLLVDWELAGAGAAGFDVGTVLAEYLCAWVGSVPIVDPADPARLVNRARYPLRRMQPALQDFWSAYRRHNPESPTLGRVVQLAAVRILQTAVERAQGLAIPSAHVVTLLQLADNLLRQPDDAARGLLGLRA